MNRAALNSLTEAEYLLVAETVSVPPWPSWTRMLCSSCTPESGERGASTSSSTAGEAGPRVAELGGRGFAGSKNQRNRDKAEVFELALARVSRRVSVVAGQAADDLRSGRLEAARSGGSGPASGQGSAPGASSKGQLLVAGRRPARRRVERRRTRRRGRGRAHAGRRSATAVDRRSVVPGIAWPPHPSGSGRRHAAVGLGDEQVETQPLRQEVRGELAAHAVAGRSSGGANVPRPPLPGAAVTMPPPIPLLPGSPIVVEPVARGLVEAGGRHHRERAAAGRRVDDPLPVTGLTPPSASVAPMTARSRAVTRRSSAGCRGRRRRPGRRRAGRSSAAGRAMLRLRWLVADAEA